MPGKAVFLFPGIIHTALGLVEGLQTSDSNSIPLTSITSSAPNEVTESTQNDIRSTEFSAGEGIAGDLLSFKTGTILDSTEIRAILGGVVGFWGGVFCMGSLFMTLVLIKRCIHRKSQEDNE